MKIAYLHNLPLEYYPPATNLLDMLAGIRHTEVRAWSTHNLRARTPYLSEVIPVSRTRAPKPGAMPAWRLVVAFWWHLRTAVSLLVFRPGAIVYVEPHSAIAAWIYYRIFRGSADLFIHHHEYYEPGDYRRPGMRLPRMGWGMERRYLFGRARWISQTNEERLKLIRQDNPEVGSEVWKVLPNYPPKTWDAQHRVDERVRAGSRLRLIYIGSASFEDTYIEEVVRWAAAHRDAAELHISGYNVSADVWAWLREDNFPNVTIDTGGYKYEELPGILQAHDIGLVLYKGNTTNFVYNVPNKVFEYLRCGLDVWYPREMAGIRNFCEANEFALREVDYADMKDLPPARLETLGCDADRISAFTAERAFAPLFEALGLNQGASPA